MVTEERRILVDKWYDWAEGILGRKFPINQNQRPTIEDGGERKPHFHALISDQELMGKLVA